MRSDPSHESVGKVKKDQLQESQIRTGFGIYSSRMDGVPGLVVTPRDGLKPRPRSS